MIVSAPSENLHVRGQTLEYDLPTDRITLAGSDEVILQRAGSEIPRGGSITALAAPVAWARSWPKGPAGSAGRWTTGRKVNQASWGGLLQVRPYEQNQVISLSGGAQLKFAGIGQLDAPEVHLYLVESPKAGNPTRFDLQPDRMLACLANQMLAGGNGAGGGNPLPAAQSVLVQSPQFSAAVSRLELWFDGVEKTAAAGNILLDGRLEALVARRGHQPQHFEVVGRLLRARMSGQAGRAAELSELTIEDGVRFVETQTEQPDQQPLSIRGDRLHAIHVTQPHGSVTVTGRPARFEARGLAMSGSNINLNRGTNRLWIDGAGTDGLAAGSRPGGPRPEHSQTLAVEWQDRMVFDGRTACFEESVVASGPQQRLLTETLEVQFQQPIDFSAQEIDVAQRPKVEQILCRGGVRMESQTIENGATVSHEQMQVPDLGINLNSGR